MRNKYVVVLSRISKQIKLDLLNLMLSLADFIDQ